VIQGDSIEPRPEGASLAVGPDRLHGLDEGGLCDLLGELGVGAMPAKQPVDPGSAGSA
jgi:hypothetical protein